MPGDDPESSWDSDRYQNLIALAFSATDSASRGRTLEDLIAYTFSCIPGLTVLARDARMGSQELDLVLWNDRACEYFNSASAEIIIECKNWDAPVGSAEVSWFLEKLRQRSVSHGFLITRSGVTGAFRDGRDGALDSLYGTLRDGTRPVVLTLDELSEVTSISQLISLFKFKIGRLMIRRL